MTFDHLVRQVREGRLWTRGTPRVAIIGAGISGLAAYRAMLSEGILPIVLEQCHEAGGVWSILPHFTTYDGLIQNTSARQMALDGLAVPRPRHGDHFSREEYASYVHAYSESIYSRTRIFKGCKVQSIAPRTRWRDFSCSYISLTAVRASGLRGRSRYLRGRIASHAVFRPYTRYREVPGSARSLHRFRRFPVSWGKHGITHQPALLA
jgi:Flavin-binding monooxygenase-like